MPYRRVFDVVWSGRRNLIMMASQIDRTGNQNISAIGPWARPKAQLVGVRGAPGQHRQPLDELLGAEPLDPLLRRAGRRGVGRRATPGPRRPARRRPGSTRSATSSPTSASSTSPRADQVDAAGVGPSRGDRRRGRRGHRVRARRPRRRARHPRLRRPRSSICSAPCSTRGACATARCGREPSRRCTPPSAIWSGCATRSCRPGMGWVAGPRLVAATAEAGGLGILASATMTFDELVTGHRRGAVPHRPSRSASTCAPTSPTSATGWR